MRTNESSIYSRSVRSHSQIACVPRNDKGKNDHISAGTTRMVPRHHLLVFGTCSIHVCATTISSGLLRINGLFGKQAISFGMEGDLRYTKMSLVRGWLRTLFLCRLGKSIIGEIYLADHLNNKLGPLR